MRILSRLRVAGISLALLGLSGCFFLMSGTISSNAGKGNSVSATSSDWGILRLTIPSGLTASVNGQLVGQCSSGKVSNVTTELSMRDFLLLAQMYTVAATGICQ
jgi:hypothetical protein